MAEQQKSLRSPLSRARGLGSAKEGTQHFIMQRLSAMAMVPLLVFFLTQLTHIATTDFSDFTVWASQIYVAIALVLFIMASFYHAALGIQVIIEDYVHHELSKVAFLALNKIIFFFTGVAAIYAVIAINAGFYR